MCAAYAGNIEAVKFLVEKSLNVNIETQDDCWIGTGKTALYYANEHGHKKVVELLQGKKVNHE
jgi:ankyrin repeat protein